MSADYINVIIELDNLDVPSTETRETYDKIKKYVPVNDIMTMIILKKFIYIIQTYCLSNREK